MIQAINYHAIACLHPYAGEYRPRAVTVGEYNLPDHYRVETLMDDFVNMVNRSWDSQNEVTLAAIVLWRLNWIHYSLTVMAEQHGQHAILFGSIRDS